MLQLAKDSPTWGYGRIQGALRNLGHEISDTTVASILKAHGIEPAPDRRRQSAWKSFLEAHWDVLASLDFTTIEVWTKSGLVTCYLLFVMELATRRVHFAGCTANPEELWMLQAARNLGGAELPNVPRFPLPPCRPRLWPLSDPNRPSQTQLWVGRVSSPHGFHCTTCSRRIFASE